MGDTKIEWTDKTWNPVRGCEILSPGCRNCYAMRQAHRQNRPGGAYEGLTMMSKRGPVWTGELRTVGDALELPLHWRKPCRIFVNSMSDLFHDDVDELFIDRVIAIAARCPQHEFQILTKRSRRMYEHMAWPFRPASILQADPQCPPDIVHGRWPLPNVWLGVSVEDQERADERIPHLLQTPAAVRWLSCEPLLGPVSLRWLPAFDGKCLKPRAPGVTTNEFDGARMIDWVVVGGESGYGARPMHPDWARALRDQCAAAGVPFFFKQWGNWMEVDGAHRDPETGDHRVIHVPSSEAEDTFDASSDCLIAGDGRVFRSPEQIPEDVPCRQMTRGPKKWCGRELDGRTHDEYPA